MMMLILSALAQTPDPGTDPVLSTLDRAESTYSLPVLLSQPPVSYPPEALAAGKEAAVLLELAVDETGAVQSVRVAEAAGEGFDAPAAAAARGFLFRPAMDAAGQPVASVILYRYVFVVERAAVPSIEGSVLDAEDLAVPGLELRVTGTDGTVVYALTDDTGRFGLSGLASGSWAIQAVETRYRLPATVVEVRDGAVIQALLRLEPEPSAQQSGPGAEVDVVASRPDSSITERRLSQEEVRFLPGTGGDVVKAVQNLPGVARAPLGVGQLIIRGTAPEDSAYFLDGSSIPVVFHFSGLSTVINGDFVSEVAYLPGNYSARYGRILGGLVDLRTKSAIPEKSRGYVSLDLFQGTAYVEQKVGDQTALEFSLRRSWIDAILTPVLSSTGSSFRAPQYWDAQARVLHGFDDGGSFDALFVFSADRFRFVGDEEDGVAIGLSTTFAKLRARWLQPLSGGWESELSVIGGPEDQSFAFDGDEEAAFERTLGFGVREELYLGTTEERPLGWRIGADLQGGRDSFEYNVEQFSPYEAGESWFFAPALYVEPTWEIGKTAITPGLRADALLYDFGYAHATADPRLALQYALTQTTLLKASVGRYAQFATTRQLDPDADGNDALSEAWSLQSSLGITQVLTPALILEATAYYNRLYDLVEGREDRFRFFTGPPPAGPFDTDPYGNGGTGRVCGTELLLRLNTEKTLGLLSATFSSSTRTGRDGVADLFEYDQPFVINALVSQELPRNWRIGARGRVGAGDPYTPVVNRVYDMESRSFIPIYGERDAARIPPTWSVDLRFDKEWAFKRWTLTTYLDLQNAFNVQNPEVMAWTYDYSAEDPINGLPIVPAFGLRGEW